MSDTRDRLSALACALALPLCALIARPWVEQGVNDDWSYIKSAQVLAQTGHIAYNGWSTASLGWQLYLGALFIKLFGFSFTATRAATVLVAMLTAYLFHRILARVGVGVWLSSLATLTLVLSPLFFPFAFTFMTDVEGLFILLLCLYACLRALTAGSARSALIWFAFACVSNALGGSVRQIAWLGLLVTVPCTLWLLRGRYSRRLLTAFVAIAGISALAIPLTMHWYSRQPYTLPELLIPGRITRGVLSNLGRNLAYTALEFLFFLLPVFAVCFASVKALVRRVRWLIPAMIIGTLILVPLVYLYRYSPQLERWEFPTLVNCVTVYGLLFGTPAQGNAPIVIDDRVRILITAYSLLATAAFFAMLFPRKEKMAAGQEARVEPGVSWRQLAWLTVPVTLAYVLLLCPRAGFMVIFDRYLLAPIALMLVPICRAIEERLRPGALRRSGMVMGFGTLVLFASFAIAGTHDIFSRFRAEVKAIAELESAGVPPSHIDGSVEFNGWNEVNRTGFVTYPRLTDPHFAGFPQPSPKCTPVMGFAFPSLDARFGVAFQPNICGGPAGFAPVPFSTWLAPTGQAIYVVREMGSGASVPR